MFHNYFLFNTHRNLYGSRSVFTCWPVLVSYRRFTFLSLQVLGPSSVGLPVHKLAWTVWRQVTFWPMQFTAPFIQWSCLESSAQVGCFLTTSLDDDCRSAGGAANRDSCMHLYTERVAWGLRRFTYLDHWTVYQASLPVIPSLIIIYNSSCE